MKIHITSWYMATVNDIIYNNIDQDIEPVVVDGVKEIIEYKIYNEELYNKYDRWLSYAGYCELIKSYKIERQ